MAGDRCEHFDLIGSPPPRTKGCEECVALGTSWTALRVCMSCGHVGCCEDSPHAHALAHFNATGHPIIRPLERGQGWTWCYPHHRYFAPLPAPEMRGASGYDATAKWLHWLIVVLVLTQFTIAWLMPGIGRNTKPGPLIDLHFSFGVVIAVVMAVRFVHRLVHPVPLAMPASPAWERAVARATHGIFYAALLIGPFLGWASASAHDLPVSVFGLLPLPAIATSHDRWALVAGDIHTYTMWAVLALIGLHAAVALFHHFVRHDDILERMLPGRA